MPFQKDQRQPGPQNSPLSRWQFPWVVLPVFAVYLSTLNPSLFRNDSPETITACWTLGVSHPPGYPLHTLLGSLFSHLVMGNPAMTINLFSALVGALGAYLFFLNALHFLSSLPKTRADHSLISASIGTFCFAFSRSYWSASLAAKGGIYSFQILLELGVLLFLQYWLRYQADRGSSSQGTRFYFLVFLFALGLTNQWPTHLLFLAALTVGYWVIPGRLRSKDLPWKKLWFVASVALIVSSLYLYLPLRAHQGPNLNFGSPSSWSRLSSSVFRTHYFKTETLASFVPTAISTMKAKGLYISDRFSSEYSGLFSLLCLFGVWALWTRSSRHGLLFLVAITFITLFTNILYLQVEPIEYWHMNDHLLTINGSMAFLGTSGLLFLLVSSQKRKAMGFGLGILVLLLPAFTIQKNLKTNDQTREFLFRGYGIEALRSMDRNADYFAESDYDYFSILYLSEVEKRRRDIDLTLTTFMGEKDWRDLWEQEMTQPRDLRPKYCAFPNGDFIHGYLKRAQRASLMPTGTIIRFMPSEEALRKYPDQEPLEDLWQRYLSTDRGTLHPIDGLLREICAHPYLNMANYLRLRGSTDLWGPYHVRALELVQDPAWRRTILQETLMDSPQQGSKTKNPTPLSKGRVQ